MQPSSPGIRIPDHPRVGGEKFGEVVDIMNLEGSPPRRRGKVAVLGRFLLLGGITPAWAGKSAGERQRPPCPQDYPRVGGEKLAAYFETSAHAGSPPRRRGKGLDFLLELLQLGITPAWAGKRRCQLSTYTVVWDHPRVGGEKRFASASLDAYWGSPPRGRGKARHLSHGLLPCG